jgi:TetR/AcrR family transcriptional regulator, regulator of biofilm formation and stress response
MAIDQRQPENDTSDAVRAHEASWMPDAADVVVPTPLPETNDRRSVDERRIQLIDAAVAILAEEGLGRATTRNITDRAGLALGAFHYAFSSKDELLAAVMERIAAATEEALEEALAAPGGTNAVGRLLDGFWRFIDAEPQMQLAKAELTVHALRDPAMRPLAEAQYQRYSTAIERLLARAPELANAPSECESMARYLVATLDGLVMQRLIQGDPAAARDRLTLHQRALDHVVPDLPETRAS